MARKRKFKLVETICGLTHSGSGKDFSANRARQHSLDCVYCRIKIVDSKLSPEKLHENFPYLKIKLINNIRASQRKILKSKCGRSSSKNNKLFTKQSLLAHENSCFDCLGLSQKKRNYYDPDANFPMANLLAEDESDGVFFAIAWEHGELF